MWGKLSVIDTEHWVYVAPQHDPEDWVARFEKAHAFPARDWAERMVALHNSELRERAHRRSVVAPANKDAPFDPRARSADVNRTR